MPPRLPELIGRDWGYNWDGELGLGNNAFEYSTPQHLPPPTGYTFTAISANIYGAEAILAPVAVPEPATLTLAGISCLALLRRRRGRKWMIRGV